MFKQFLGQNGKYVFVGLAGIGSTYMLNHKLKKHPSIVKQNMFYNETDYKNEKVEYVVIGAGTGGCLTAYFLSKWLDDLKIPGNVILVESGDEYMTKKGPSPNMEDWFSNWKNFCVVHENVNSDVDHAIASSHVGVGGGSTHDTRITFLPTQDQRKRISKEMGWTENEINVYFQSVLNMIPVQSAGCNERFYDEIIDKLSKSSNLNRLNDNECKAQIISDSVSYVSMAMFPDESRWTCAYLLHDSIRPKKLKVVKNWTVDKILFKKNEDGSISPVSVVSSNDEYIDLKKGGEVIITAGSLGTPAILQRSGIGPKALLNDLKICPIVINDEIGHGVDHAEVPVSYEWLDKWKETDGKMPRGGPMAWPLAIFFDDKDGKSIMAHFGISPPPYEHGKEVTGTPNCSSPDHSKGFFAQISSPNPKDPLKIRHVYCEEDFAQISRGVKKMINTFEVLKKEGIVGNRVHPSSKINIDDDKQLNKWISQNLGTAYHWMSTCKAGKNSIVVDEKFKLRGITGLRIGSGAVLPEIPEANPHLTISAFSVALAHSIIKDKHPYMIVIDNDGFSLRSITQNDFVELENAQTVLNLNNGRCLIKRYENVTPDLRHLVKQHIEIITKNKD